VLLLACIAAAPSPAQKVRLSTLMAMVLTDSTSASVSGAEISVVGLDAPAKTDSLGEASIPKISFGVHTVRVRALGYTPLEARVIFRTDTMAAMFYLKRASMLKPASVEMDTVRISAPGVSPGLEEFESRRALCLGRFLTRADLDGVGQIDFQTLMSVRFPGLKVVPLANGEHVLASTRGSCGADPSRVGNTGRAGRSTGGSSCLSDVPCVVPTFLDGEDVRGAGASARPSELAGVEYYTGSQIPVQYRVSGSGCGVLVLWSRR